MEESYRNMEQHIDRSSDSWQSPCEGLQADFGMMSEVTLLQSDGLEAREGNQSINQHVSLPFRCRKTVSGKPLRQKQLSLPGPPRQKGQKFQLE